MTQDRWRDQDRWREEERRRWDEDERRRSQGYSQGREYGRGRYGDEERYGERHGGYGGQDFGQQDYGRQEYGRHEYGRGREYGRERFGEEEGYGVGRPYRGFEPTGYPGTGGSGYIPSQYPEERRFGREYGRSHGEDWSGRGYEETYPRRSGQERGWWDRARDEVYSWMGDEGAEQRRRADEMLGHHGRGPKGYTRSDERIREDVSDRLTDDWLVDASNIEVTVSNCEVTLTGTVDSRAAKRRAEDCAENVSGVRNVQNSIRVQQPTESTSAFGSGATSATGLGTTASTKSNR